MGGSLKEQRTVIERLIEFEASASDEGSPSIPVIVSYGSHVELRTNS